MYDPKCVLITGCLGFIASHLTVYLVIHYPEIQFIGIDKETYCSNAKNIAEISSAPNFIYQKLDLTNENDVITLFKAYPIDTVYHLAAYSHVDLSFHNSILFTLNNVLATHILIETARTYSIRRFIHVSTDEVYGSKDETLHENCILDPTNPYAASKASAEHIVRSYYHSFRFPIIITRSNNIYGPKQYDEKVIPRFCSRLLSNQPCFIQGSGEQKRSFLYVDDVVRAFDLILFSGGIGEIYNIGSSDEITVNDLAKMMINIISPDASIEYGPDRPFNDHRYFLNSSKVEQLGWTKIVSFSEGLRKTIDWYRDNSDYWKS